MTLLHLAKTYFYGGLILFSALLTIGCETQVEDDDGRPTITHTSTVSATMETTDELLAIVISPTPLSLSSTATLLPSPTRPSAVVIDETLESGSNHGAPPTATADIEVTPTPTPVPTLSVEQENILLTTLIVGNNECNLLCWWNVVPGETSEEAARELFAAKGIDDWVNSFNRTYVIMGLGYGTPDSSSYSRDVIVHFWTESDLIEYITVDGGYRHEELRPIFVRDWQSYSPAEILNRFGIPLYVEFTEVGNSPYYRLVLSYESLGIEVSYMVPFELVAGDKVKICFALENVDYIYITSYRPGQASNVPSGILPNRLDSYVSWESATGLGLEDFQQLFSDINNPPCIVIG